MAALNTAPAHSRPKVGVAVVITSPKHPGCVILGVRKGSAGAGKWALPGGHLEFGESWETCTRREVEEETGLRLGEVRFVKVVNAVQVEEDYHYITLFLQAEIDLGHQAEPENVEPEKCEGWEWVDWDKFPSPDKLFCPLRVVREEGFHPFKS